MTKVAIIILIYNGLRYLRPLFNSLNQQAKDGLSLEIIVVDNHSSDGSVKFIKDNFPEVTLIENRENLGFAAGNNLGLVYALKKNFDYLVLINQDIIVTPLWLVLLLKGLVGDRQSGLAQPLILSWPNKEKINSSGNILHYLGVGFSGNNGLNYERADNFPREINYASGAAMAVKREVLEKIGLFDETFFMYHEDTDLSLKAKFLGYKIILVPEAIVYHQYEFSKSIKKFYFIERNRLIILLKFYKILTLILIFPAWLFLEIGFLVQAIFTGFIKQRIKIYWYFINPGNLSKILKARVPIQKTRIISDKKLLKELTGKIEFQEVNNVFLKFIFNPILNAYKKLVEKIIIW